MEDNSSPKVTMFFYLLKEGDVKEPLNKYNIIPKKLYIIGRSSKECDIVLDEKLLSRKHAELLYIDKNEIIVRDLNSRNGTFINKERIEPNKEHLFSLNETLSFGSINNEIVFYDNTDNKKEEDTDKEKSNKQNIYNSQDNNNYQSSEKIENIQKNYSKSQDTKKNLNINDNKDYPRKSNIQSYSLKNKSRSRSRSKETQRQNSKRFSGLEDIIKNLDQRNKEQENKSKYYDRYNNREDYYRNRQSFGRDRERERERNTFKRNDRYDYEDYDRKGRFNEEKEIKDDFEKNKDDNGFIKCYVSGYMMLKIKK